MRIKANGNASQEEADSQCHLEACQALFARYPNQITIDWQGRLCNIRLIPVTRSESAQPADYIAFVRLVLISSESGRVDESRLSMALIDKASPDRRSHRTLSI